MPPEPVPRPSPQLELRVSLGESVLVGERQGPSFDKLRMLDKHRILHPELVEGRAPIQVKNHLQAARDFRLQVLPWHLGAFSDLPSIARLL